MQTSRIMISRLCNHKSWKSTTYASYFKNNVLTSKQHTCIIRDYNILFFGSDQFSLHSLRKLHASNNHSLFVMVPQDVANSSKESTPVREYCQEHQIPYVHPASPTKLLKSDYDVILQSEEAKKMGIQHFDIGVAVSFRYFIPKTILSQFSIATLNVHPSLLPQYRGAAPIHHVLLNGDKETGISIIELNPEKFDVGNILYQERIPIPSDETYSSLYCRLGERGAELLEDVINNIEQRKKQGISQKDLESSVTQQQPLILASKVTPDLKMIDWINDSSAKIYNRWRALETVRGTFNGEDYLFIELHMKTAQDPAVVDHMKNNLDVPAGSYLYDKVLKSLYIKAGDGVWVGCTALQKPGKRVFSAQDYDHQQLVKQKNRDRLQQQQTKRKGSTDNEKKQ